jgi:Fur family ferric uptake transcriptional regulator
MARHVPSSTAATARLPAEVQARLSAAGLRRTLATRVVLGLFLAAPAQAYTHTQVAAQVQARGLEVNRVTLYRLLDRLVACGVLVRETEVFSRTWRFRLAGAPGPAAVPRFECDRCHRHWPLEGAGAAAQAWLESALAGLAERGHHGMQVELAVRGICADCAATTPSATV